MKYLKQYRIFEDNTQDQYFQMEQIEDILLDISDDGYWVDVKDNYKKDIFISICIPKGESDLEGFKFSKIEDVVRRIIDYLPDYKFSFQVWGSDTKLIKKSLDDLSNDDILLFQSWLTK
jgi:hypothetical protein